MSKKTETTFVTKANLKSVDVSKKDASNLLADSKKLMQTQGTLNKKIQINAIGFAMHLVEHGDIRPLREFFDLLEEQRPHDLNSMKAYFEKFTPVRFDEEGQVHYDATSEYSLSKLMSEKWWLVAKPPVYKSYVLADEIQNLINRTEKRIDNPKEGIEDNIDRELLQALRDTLAA